MHDWQTVEGVRERLLAWERASSRALLTATPQAQQQQRRLRRSVTSIVGRCKPLRVVDQRMF